MATLVFNCEHKYSNEINYPRIEIFHGDVKITAWKHHRYKDFFGRDCVDYLEKDAAYRDEEIPEWEALKNGNCSPNLAIDTWEYEAVDVESEEPYKPISIMRAFQHKELNEYHGQKFEDLLVKMFDIPSFEEMVNFVEKTNITRFVIKRNVTIYVTHVCNNVSGWCSYDVITTSFPHVDLMTVSWKDRWRWPWKRRCKGNPENYAKEIKLEVLNGDNGMHLIGWFGSIDDSYPMDGDVAESWLNGETINYSNLYLVPERVKEERLAIEERREAERRQLELNKMIDGYCDRCGSPRAQYIRDPFRGLATWLCPHCYSDEYEYDYD